MRVGYVLRKYPKLSETFVLNEMLELERQGAELTVFSLGHSTDPHFHGGIGHLKAPIRYLGVESSDDFAGRLRRLGDRLGGKSDDLGRAFSTMLRHPDRSFLRKLRLGLELAEAVADEGTERLHAHFAGLAADVAGFASRLTDVPFSFTCHAKDIYHEQADLSALKELAGHASAVVTVCDANRDHLRRHLSPADHGKLITLYNGVDLDFFTPRSRTPSDRASFLGVGRLVPKKGFGHLIDAVALLERQGVFVECSIAGDGVERGALERRAEATGVKKLSFLGAVEQHRVRELLAESTALVLPCVVADDGNRDALPTVILEAMASGTPVISTPITGISEMIAHDRTGLLVPPQDPRALARAMRRVAEAPGWAATLAAGAREDAEDRFDLRKNVRRLLSVFESNGALQVQT